ERARYVATALEAGDQLGTERVVDIDDRCAQLGPLEQTELGLAVIVESAVVIEMVVSKVGEDGDVDAHRIEPALHDPDRRSLNGDDGGSCIAQGGQVTMHGKYVGSGQLAAQVAAIGQGDTQRADRAAGGAARVQRCGNPLYGGRL